MIQQVKILFKFLLQLYVLHTTNICKRMTELTNLNWVAGVPIISSSSSSSSDFSGTRPCARPLFPIPQTAVDRCTNQGRSITASWTNKSENGRSTGNGQLTPRSRHGKNRATATSTKYKRPDCSYACLIAMALFASEKGFLPVNEIYRIIE